ncbi:uncharacterized protein phf11 isoform 2-T2 [Anableps anableps]
MNHRLIASCLLCLGSEETKTTGTLSTKDQVTAHQNCLLFSSGIFCTNTPQFDDLFGFSVDDVLKEVKRGGKLLCSHCKKKGATAGCEVGRCKKTFHYPCAVEGGAKTFEDDQHGKYGLYCQKHSNQESGSSVHKPKTPRLSKNPSKAGSSKVCVFLRMYCAKHAPSSLKKKANGDLLAARQSTSSSSDSSSTSFTSTKRQLCFNELEEEECAFRRKSVKRNRLLSDESSNTDEEGLMAPLESDFEESANSVQEHESALPQLISKDSEKPSGSSAGRQVENVNAELNNNEDETLIHSDAESESLLCPVAERAEFHPNPAPQTVTDQCTQVLSMEKEVQTIKREIEEPSLEQREEDVDEPSVPQQSSAPPGPHPERSNPSNPPPCTGSSFNSPLRTPPHLEPSPHTPAPPSQPKPDVDSASFWRNCNTAGCTQKIFTEFVAEINDVSSRIQSDRASQQDYDWALTVMMASGRLADLVTKQEEELERRQMELQRALTSLKDVVSVLRR